jgi:hypothetical protein
MGIRQLRITWEIIMNTDLVFTKITIRPSNGTKKLLKMEIRKQLKT